MRTTDAAPVAALIRAAFAAQPCEVVPPPSALRVTEADVATHLAHAGGAVIEADGALIGAALWEAKDGGLYISRVSVAPAWRRRGVARALLAAAEDAGRQAGLPRLLLGTRLVLTGNRRLFAACGFVEITQHAHPGFASPTWVEMEKRLDP